MGRIYWELIRACGHNYCLPAPTGFNNYRLVMQLEKRQPHRLIQHVLFGPDELSVESLLISYIDFKR